MCGLKEQSIQKRLLSETTLPLDKALEIGVAIDAIELQGKDKEANVECIQKDRQTSQCSSNRSKRGQSFTCF